MRSIGRLLIGYLLAGVLVAALENWTAHTRASGSVFEVVVSNEPPAKKTAAFYDLVLFPILAWPVRVLEIIKGG